MNSSSTHKPNIRQAVPFFAVSDMEKSLKFYTEGLGFDLLHTWIPHGKIEWCWLQRGGGAIMLQEFRKEGQNAKPFPELPGAGVTVCFQCEDSLELYHEFTSRGIEVAEPFVGNGLWDVGLKDPDGYHLHFESPAMAPEETTYAEWKNSSR